MTRLRTERRLARALFGRFFESELMPAGLTQVQVVIWSVALFAAPGYLLSLVFAMKYGGVPRERLVQATQADRLFFVTFAMMAVGMVALFTWESLFPGSQRPESDPRRTGCPSRRGTLPSSARPRL